MKETKSQMQGYAAIILAKQRIRKGQLSIPKAVHRSINDKMPVSSVVMETEDLLKSERAKVAALEDWLMKALSCLRGVGALEDCPEELRDWYGQHRARLRKESESKTSKEAWKV